MNKDLLRSDMIALRKNAEYEGEAVKNSYVVIDRLREFYQTLSKTDRRIANYVFGEWITSEDEAVRYDAILFVNQFQIAEALPALRDLAFRLPLSTKPGASYELKKVLRTIEKLSGFAIRPPHKRSRR